MMRILISASTVYLGNFAILQIAVGLYSSIIMLAFIIREKPMQDSHVSKMEKFYHLFFMATSYMSILQSDFILDPVFRYKIGDNFFYAVLGFIAFNVIVIILKIGYMIY